MATIELKIADTLTTIDLASADGAIVAYFPATPNLRTRTLSQSQIDGQEQFSTAYDDVTETITIDLKNGTTTARDKVQQLNRLFEQARNYRKLPASTWVYLKFRPDTAEDLYRSQIVNGRASWQPELLDQLNMTIPTIEITITRKFYWEADTAVELALGLTTGGSITGAGYVTGGVTILNHEDATANHSNCVEVAANAVIGDLPAPIRIEFTNLAASQQGMIYVGYEWCAWDGIVTVTRLEGESATPLNNVADGGSSAGNYNRLTWPGTAEADLASWATAFSQTVLAQYMGRFVRVLARFANAPTYTDLWLRLKLSNAAGTILQTVKLLISSASLQLQEVGSVQLPPHLSALDIVDTISLALEGTRTGAPAAVNISSSTNANPSVVTTATAHGLTSGDYVRIAGHLVNTAINGDRVATVLSPTTFSVPLAANGVGGATGSVQKDTVLDLDMLKLVVLDGWRKYTPVNGGLTQNSVLKDDMLLPPGHTYVKQAGTTNVLKNYAVEGDPIQLKPKLYRHRLRFAWMRSTGVSTVDDSATVQVYYRPRRLSI